MISMATGDPVKGSQSSPKRSKSSKTTPVDAEKARLADKELSFLDEDFGESRVCNN
jgi:hypothetical protein